MRESTQQHEYSFEEVINRIERVEDVVSSLDRAIRGNNGTQGLITQVALLDQRLASKDKQEKQNITMTWIVEKLIVPVTTAVVTALLLARVLAGG